MKVEVYWARYELTVLEKRTAIPTHWVVGEYELERGWLRGVESYGGVRPRLTNTYNIVDRDNGGFVTVVAEMSRTPEDPTPSYLITLPGFRGRPEGHKHNEGWREAYKKFLDCMPA